MIRYRESSRESKLQRELASIHLHLSGTVREIKCYIPSHLQDEITPANKYLITNQVSFVTSNWIPLQNHFQHTLTCDSEFATSFRKSSFNYNNKK